MFWQITYWCDKRKEEKEKWKKGKKKKQHRICL